MIRQGHKYSYFDNHVIAIEPSGVLGLWFVRKIGEYFLSDRQLVHEWHLKPLPMKYFHGQIPE